MEMVIRNTISILLLLMTTMAVADAGLPDPTRPADYSAAAAVQHLTPKTRAEFSVNAIRISDLGRSAIVNGRLICEGDEIGTARVKQINAANVVLDYERELVTIPLYAEGIKKHYKTPGDKD